MLFYDSIPLSHTANPVPPGVASSFGRPLAHSQPHLVRPRHVLLQPPSIRRDQHM